VLTGGQRHAEQADPFAERIDLIEQGVTVGFDLGDVQGSAARDLVEVDELDLQGGGAPARALCLTVLPEPWKSGGQLRPGGLQLEDVHHKGVLSANGLARPIRLSHGASPPRHSFPKSSSSAPLPKRPAC
jgi:hypothetical protein